MRSASFILAVLAGSAAAQTSAPIDDPNYLLTAQAAPTLPLADAPVLSISTTPTIVPAVNTEAATSAPAVTQLSAFAGSSTFIGATSELPEAHTAKSVLESLSSASASYYPPLPTSAPLVPTNATGQGPAITELSTFSGPIATDLPDAHTAHTLLSSLIPSLTLESSTAAASPRPSLPASVVPAPAPAPALYTSAPAAEDEDECEKDKTTLVTSVRPTSGAAYPSGGGYSYKPKPYKSYSPDDKEKAYYSRMLAKMQRWAVEHGYR